MAKINWLWDAIKENTGRYPQYVAEDKGYMFFQMYEEVYNLPPPDSELFGPHNQAYFQIATRILINNYMSWVREWRPKGCQRKHKM